MKIISYNVNGIRAAIGKGFIEWLGQTGADVVCLQESKAQPDQIPIMEFESIGYQTFWHSAEKKGYSGVAILTKIKPDHITYGIGIPEYDREGRFLRADYGDLSIVSVYHPSGSSGDERQEFKMKWLDDFYDKVHELKKERPNLIISGDYNICHKEIDIHDPKGNKNNSGFLPEEREWIGKFIDSGFIDTFREFHPEPHRYSWWSYRRQARDRNLGWRIDYHMVTENLKSRLKDADILDQVVHSDHCPITLEID
ncbi:MAG: exodeoxyribonuclease III [Marinilabiliales bacterium]|nr:MAG: exodeoxyribonuclease III [Marinilabiliales bacterium]